MVFIVIHNIILACLLGLNVNVVEKKKKTYFLLFFSVGLNQANPEYR